MAVAGGVNDELADDLTGVGVDDGDVMVLDGHGDAGSLGRPADADVVEAAVESQGDVAGRIDPVGADALRWAGPGGTLVIDHPAVVSEPMPQSRKRC